MAFDSLYEYIDTLESIGKLHRVSPFKDQYRRVGGGKLRVNAGIIEGVIGVSQNLHRLLPGAGRRFGFGIPELAKP